LPIERFWHHWIGCVNRSEVDARQSPSQWLWFD
jgi:hypothetical protein